MGGFSFCLSIRRISPVFAAVYGAFLFPVSVPIPRRPPLYSALQPPHDTRIITAQRSKDTNSKTAKTFSKNIFRFCYKRVSPRGIDAKRHNNKPHGTQNPAAQQPARGTAKTSAEKIPKRKFSKLVTNAVPHGVTTENAAQQRRHKFNSTAQKGRKPRTGKSNESYNALDDVSPKEIRAVGVGNRRPHEHNRNRCENVKATDYVMQEMAP